jgi:hypothetical protein
MGREQPAPWGAAKVMLEGKLASDPLVWSTWGQTLPGLGGNLLGQGTASSKAAAC